MIKLFDDKFVHFRWTDELKDKMCIVNDSIDGLEYSVLNSIDVTEVKKSGDDSYPFRSCINGVNGSIYRFCYYDPHYDIKVAFNDRETIECQGLNEDGSFCWFAVKTEEDLLEFIAQDRYLRIKSDTEEVKPVIPVNLDNQKFREIMDSLNDHLERIERLEKNVECIKQYIANVKISR